MINELDKSYFKYDKDKILLDTYKCEIYVPQSYFESKMAIQDGELYNVLFILKYRLFHTENSDSLKMPVNDFLFPSMILTKPDMVSTADMDIYGAKEKITIFTYYKNGEILHNRNIVKSSAMVERFFTLLINGKMKIVYKAANAVLNRVQKIHDIKLNVPQYIQELVLSEVYRSKKDLSTPARFVAQANDIDDKNLKGLNMRENAAYTSTLAGVGFEDINSMLTVADNRDDKKQTQYNPIEKAIRGLRNKSKIV